MRKRDTHSIQLQLPLTGSEELERLATENGHLRAENNRLKIENSRLVQELERLKNPASIQQADDSLESVLEPLAMDLQPPETKTIPSSDIVTKRSPIEDKIVLFRSYFKGRDDVYAVRGTDRTGKPAYFTKRQYLGNKDGKTLWGENLPLTDDVIRKHLQDENSPMTVGMYPLMLDESCWFLAVDFDKANWREDAVAYLDTCRKLNIPAAFERSRSGNGAHIWVFFEEPIPAVLARKLGSTVITLTLEKRHQLGLESYDRMFPNQDTLPKEKKLGNLIALPLQRISGKAGNSLFLDAEFEPHKDQWIFLSSLLKMTLHEVESIVRRSEREGNIIRIAKAQSDDDDNVEALESVGD